jgi:hypothetical protein
MGGPFNDGLDPMELAIFLAVSEEFSDEEKLLAAQESELQDEDDLADDSDWEEEKDSRPLRAEDIF